MTPRLRSAGLVQLNEVEVIQGPTGQRQSLLGGCWYGTGLPITVGSTPAAAQATLPSDSASPRPSSAARSY